MQTEIEAKFLQIDPDDMRQRLEAAGASCAQPMRMMRRTTFDNDQMNAKRSFVRIRDEGHRVTMTYKQYDSQLMGGAKEIEFSVSDYEAAIEFMKVIGIGVKSVQEARREIWKLGDVEVVIDEWPWISPFIEIEGPTERSVKDTARKLGLSWKDASFGDVMTAYRAEYPKTGTSAQDMVYNLPNVRFEDTVPAILKA